MGLSTIVGNALDGLQTTQRAISIVARNVSNADTAGYTRKVHNQSTNILGDNSSVVADTATRQLDTVLQRQLRAERASSGYADTMATYHGRIDALFGEPGGENALDTQINAFQESLQALATSPDDYSTRSSVVGQAEGLAGHLNGLSADIQRLREEAEQGLAEAVGQANTLLQNIADLNNQIVVQKANGTLNPDTLDKRDLAVDELSRLVDLRVVESASGALSISTASGAFLVDTQAALLEFDEHASLDAGALYTADPATRGVGTITMQMPNGSRYDLLREGAFRSGEIAALATMRDTVLVEAQAQLDELASGLSLAMSTSERAGTVAGSGFLLAGVADLQRGDVMTMTVQTGGTTQTLRFVNASNPASVGEDATADPNDIVIGLDFDQPLATMRTNVQAALDARFGAGALTTAAGAGALRVLDGTANITGLSARVSADSLQGDGLALPLFVDGASGALYTGGLEGGRQQTGYAGRIVVNGGLIADNAALTKYTAATPLGDAARPQRLVDQLGKAEFTFSPKTGVGSPSVPFKGSVADYARAVVTDRGREAATALRVQEGQAIVLTGLEQRQAETSGVNIDMELADLIELQNAYSANARIMQVVQELVDTLLRM